MRDLYLSADVEADGSIPGVYSMSAIGLAACATFDGTTFTRLDMDRPAHCFYRELAPVTDQFDPEAAAVSGLDRHYLIDHGTDPREAMPALNAWARQLAASLDARPVFVAYPLPYDWMWAYHYLIRFAGESAFGHSGALDIKSQYQRAARVTLGKSTKRSMPRSLMSKRKHTHNALDDAREQGDLFCNIFEWDGTR